MQKRTRH